MAKVSESRTFRDPYAKETDSKEATGGPPGLFCTRVGSGVQVGARPAGIRLESLVDAN
jgi:hypothetical protein